MKKEDNKKIWQMTKGECFLEKAAIYKIEYKRKGSIEDLAKNIAKNSPDYAWGVRAVLEKKNFTSFKELIEFFKHIYYSASIDAKTYLCMGLGYAVEKFKSSNIDDYYFIKNNATNFYHKVEERYNLRLTEED